MSHQDQPKIKQLKGKSKSEIKVDMKPILKDGMRKYNTEQCIKENPEFQSVKLASGDCIQCQKCGGAYAKSVFGRHRFKCQGDSASFPLPCQLPSADIDDETESLEFRNLLASLHNDDIGNLCRHDETIRLFGKRYITVIVLIIFPRNVSFRGYYVFVSNAAATAAASQFRC